jgi:hypothetical protein
MSIYYSNYLSEVGSEVVEWSELALDNVQWQAF